MVGIPELMVLLVVVAYWGIPVAAAIWAIVTLKRKKSSLTWTTLTVIVTALSSSLSAHRLPSSLMS